MYAILPSFKYVFALRIKWYEINAELRVNAAYDPQLGHQHVGWWAIRLHIWVVVSASVKPGSWNDLCVSFSIEILWFYGFYLSYSFINTEFLSWKTGTKHQYSKTHILLFLINIHLQTLKFTVH